MEKETGRISQVVDKIVNKGFDTVTTSYRRFNDCNRVENKGAVDYLRTFAWGVNTIFGIFIIFVIVGILVFTILRFVGSALQFGDTLDKFPYVGPTAQSIEDFMFSQENALFITIIFGIQVVLEPLVNMFSNITCS